jgi:transcriptional regulator with GAF, ATPase, and Fis domain
MTSAAPVRHTSHPRQCPVIVATNRDLHQAVARGQFRVDLCYRLNVFDILVRPLRERPEHIVILAQWFLQQIARSTGRARAELTPAATETSSGTNGPAMSENCTTRSNAPRSSARTR